MRIKQVLLSGRMIVLMIFLILAIVSINPNPWREGVAIRNVLENSSASFAGFESPKPASAPMSREVITSINNVPIQNVAQYAQVTQGLPANMTAIVETNRGVYNVRVENPEDIGLVIYEAPQSNIRKGLDLQGGTRVLLQPRERLSNDDMSILIESMKQRLNVYGLSDLVIREANDLPPPLGSGNQYVVVEIAGATQEEVQDLLASQGKFEARIANQTTFSGGEDIRNVCRSADCSGIDPQRGCQQSGSEWVCGFRFSITLSTQAADRFANVSGGVPASPEDPSYLAEPLSLVLDGAEVDQLNIASDLRGRAVTDIQISGSGLGFSQQEAALNALQNMKQLQTLLITGSLPVEIDIAKLDSISPLLGAEFIRNALFVGMLTLISVAIVIFIRYRTLKVSLSMVFVMVSEIIMLLGVASIIGWNLDLAAIAGIIIAVGTGVDDQIVITDETLKKGKNEGRIYDWKRRLKKALFIIMAAYFTTVVAMLPLLFAGAGLLKGFAITTIIGVSIGVFITRPTYATIIEKLTKE